MITPELLKKAIKNVTDDPVRAIELQYPRIMAMSLLSTHDDSLALVAEELNRLTEPVNTIEGNSTWVFSAPDEPFFGKEIDVVRVDECPNSVTGGQDFTADEPARLEDQA